MTIAAVVLELVVLVLVELHISLVNRNRSLMVGIAFLAERVALLALLLLLALVAVGIVFRLGWVVQLLVVGIGLVVGLAVVGIDLCRAVLFYLCRAVLFEVV